jgi:hypothetical protein
MRLLIAERHAPRAAYRANDKGQRMRHALRADGHGSDPSDLTSVRPDPIAQTGCAL